MAGRVVGLVVVGIVLLAAIAFGWSFIAPDNAPPMGATPGTVAGTGTEAIVGVIARQQDGAPVAGARIDILLGGQVVTTATTGADGAFTIPVPGPNTYVARLTLPAGFTTATPEFQVPVAPGQQFPLAFPVQ